MFFGTGPAGKSHANGYLLRRTTAIFVVLVFTLFDAGRYAPQSYASPVSIVADPAAASLAVPKELGTVEESFRGARNKTVVFIQDAHDSLEAQENIAKLVGHLVKEKGIKTVFEEGYEGAVPTDQFFGFMENPALKQKVSYFLLDKLRVGGAEYAHINRTRDFDLIGVENLKLYSENIRHYQDAALNREATEEDLANLLARVESLADQYFPKNLKVLLKRQERFHAGKLSLLDYLKDLQALTPKKQEAQAASQFSRKYPAVSILLIAQTSKDRKVIEQLNALDFTAIFRDIAAWESDISKVFLQNERNRQLFGYFQGLNLLRRLNRIELTPAEYDAVKETAKDFKTQTLVEFIASETHKPVVLSKGWEQHIKAPILFYEAARARDGAVRTRLHDFTRDSGEKAAILVFGGFHANRIKEILREEGLSYIVVSPKITTIDKKHQGYYKQLMSVGHYSFETPFLASRANKPPSDYVLATQMGNHAVDQVLRSIVSIVRGPGSDSDAGSLNGVIEQQLAKSSGNAEKDGQAVAEDAFESISVHRLQSPHRGEMRDERMSAGVPAQTEKGLNSETAFLDLMRQKYGEGTAGVRAIEEDTAQWIRRSEHDALKAMLSQYQEISLKLVADLGAFFYRDGGTFDAFANKSIMDNMGFYDPNEVLKHVSEVLDSDFPRAVDAIKGKRVLVLGSGYGDSAYVWAYRAGAKEVVGVESNGLSAAEGAEFIDSKGVPNHYVVQNALDLNLGGDGFDTVICDRFLYLMAPALRYKALSEAARVLKPGGKLWVFSHIPGSWNDEWPEEEYRRVLAGLGFTDFAIKAFDGDDAFMTAGKPSVGKNPDDGEAIQAPRSEMRGEAEVRAFDQSVQKELGEIKGKLSFADVVVLVPFYNEMPEAGLPGTQGQVTDVRELVKTLGGSLQDILKKRGLKRALVLCIGETKGAQAQKTLKLLAESIPQGVDLKQAEPKVSSSGEAKVLFEVYGKEERFAGLVGKKWATRLGMKVARELGADLVSLDGDMKIGPDWLSRFVEPVLAKKANYVSPHYIRYYGKDDIPIIDQLVNPLFAALFGTAVRMPNAGEYVASRDLVEDYLNDEEIWLAGIPFEEQFAARAVVWGKKVMDVWAEEKVHKEASVENNLDAYLKIALDVFSQQIAGHPDWWQGRSFKGKGGTALPFVFRAVQATQAFLNRFLGFLFDHTGWNWLKKIRFDLINCYSGPGGIGRSSWIKTFKAEYAVFKDNGWYSKHLPEIIPVLERLENSSDAEFNFSSKEWAEAVMRFLPRYEKATVEDKPEYIKAFQPVFRARVASFVGDVEGLTLYEAEARLAEQAKDFAAAKSTVFVLEPLKKMLSTDVRSLLNAQWLDRSIPRWSVLKKMPQWGPHKNTVAEHIVGSIEELSNEPLFRKIDPRRQETVLMAQFFHDFGKNLKFRVLPDDHNLEGRDIVRPILKDLGLASDEVEKYAWYVKHHDVMFRLAYKGRLRGNIRDETLAEFIHKSTVQDVDLFTLLWIADMREASDGKAAPENRARVLDVASKLREVVAKVKVLKSEKARLAAINAFQIYLKESYVDYYKGNAEKVQGAEVSDMRGFYDLVDGGNLFGLLNAQDIKDIDVAVRFGAFSAEDRGLFFLVKKKWAKSQPAVRSEDRSVERDSFEGKPLKDIIRQLGMARAELEKEHKEARVNGLERLVKFTQIGLDEIDAAADAIQLYGESEIFPDEKTTALIKTYVVFDTESEIFALEDVPAFRRILEGGKIDTGPHAGEMLALNTYRAHHMQRAVTFFRALTSGYFGYYLNRLPQGESPEVFEKILRIFKSQYDHLSPEEKRMIWAEIKLHDIGFSESSDSVGHEARGARLAREILTKDGRFTGEQVDTICSVMERHTFVGWTYLGERRMRKFMEEANESQIRFLLLHNQADGPASGVGEMRMPARQVATIASWFDPIERKKVAEHFDEFRITKTARPSMIAPDPGPAELLRLEQAMREIVGPWREALQVQMRDRLDVTDGIINVFYRLVSLDPSFHEFVKFWKFLGYLGAIVGGQDVKIYGDITNLIPGTLRDDGIAKRTDVVVQAVLKMPPDLTLEDVRRALGGLQEGTALEFFGMPLRRTGNEILIETERVVDPSVRAEARNVVKPQATAPIRSEEIDTLSDDFHKQVLARLAIAALTRSNSWPAARVAAGFIPKGWDRLSTAAAGYSHEGEANSNDLVVDSDVNTPGLHEHAEMNLILRVLSKEKDGIKNKRDRKRYGELLEEIRNLIVTEKLNGSFLLKADDLEDNLSVNSFEEVGLEEGWDRGKIKAIMPRVVKGQATKKDWAKILNAIIKERMRISDYQRAYQNPLIKRRLDKEVIGLLKRAQDPNGNSGLADVELEHLNRALLEAFFSRQIRNAQMNAYNRGLALLEEALTLAGNPFKDGTLYVTLMPCKNCQPVLKKLQLKTIIYDETHRDPKKAGDWMGQIKKMFPAGGDTEVRQIVVTKSDRSPNANYYKALDYSPWSGDGHERFQSYVISGYGKTRKEGEDGAFLERVYATIDRNQKRMHLIYSFLGEVPPEDVPLFLDLLIKKEIDPAKLGMLQRKLASDSLKTEEDQAFLLAVFDGVNDPEIKAMLRQVLERSETESDFEGTFRARPKRAYGYFQLGLIDRAFTRYVERLNAKFPELNGKFERPTLKIKNRIAYTDLEEESRGLHHLLRKLSVEDFKLLLQERADRFDQIEKFFTGLDVISEANVDEAVDNLVEAWAWIHVGRPSHNVFRLVSQKQEEDARKTLSLEERPLMELAALKGESSEGLIWTRRLKHHEKIKEVAAIVELIRNDKNAYQFFQGPDPFSDARMQALKSQHRDIFNKIEKFSKDWQLSDEDVKKLGYELPDASPFKEVVRNEDIRKGIETTLFAEYFRLIISKQLPAEKIISIEQLLRLLDPYDLKYPGLLDELRVHHEELYQALKLYARDMRHQPVGPMTEETLTPVLEKLKREKKAEAIKIAVQRSDKSFRKLKKVLSLGAQEFSFMEDTHQLITRFQKKLYPLLTSKAEKHRNIFTNKKGIFDPALIFDLDAKEIQALFKDKIPGYLKLTFARQKLCERSEMSLERNWKADPEHAVRFVGDYAKEMIAVKDVLLTQERMAHYDGVKQYYRDEAGRINDRIAHLYKIAKKATSQTARSEMRDLKQTGVSMAPLTLQAHAARAGRMVRSILKSVQPATVFVDAEDFVGFSGAQKQEYLFVALSNKALQMVVYNERDQKDEELETLLKLERVTSTGKDLAGAQISFDRPNTPSIHLSRQILPSRELVQRLGKRVSFFKAQGQNGGTLAAALLWAWSGGETTGMAGVKKEDGFWIVAETLVNALQRSYDSTLAFAIAA